MGTAPDVTHMRGVSLVEVLIAMALAMTLMAVAIPSVERWREEGRVRGAAFHLAARCAWLRIEALHRAARVALRFTPAGSGWSVQPFVDGDWDGVRSVDILSGRDPAIGHPVDVQALFPGTTFGFAPGCPLIDGISVSPDTSPLRIGSARTLVFSPDGSSSGGTLYLRGGSSASGYAVVLLAATGRVRTLRCMPGSGQWRSDGR